MSAVCLSPASQGLREAMFVGGNLMKGCFVISKEKKGDHVDNFLKWKYEKI